MTPETPFILTRSTRFVPTFKNLDDDATLGGEGAFAAGAYWISGRILRMQWLWELGVGGTFGLSQGQPIVPMPAPFTVADIDVEAMLGLGAFGQTPILHSSSLAADSALLPRYCTASVDDTGESRVALVLFEITGAVATNAFMFDVTLPLKELALPG